MQSATFSGAGADPAPASPPGGASSLPVGVLGERSHRVPQQIAAPNAEPTAEATAVRVDTHNPASIAEHYLQRARRQAWVEFLGADEATSRVRLGTASFSIHLLARPWSLQDARVTGDAEPCVDVCEQWPDSRRCFAVLDALDDCHDLLAAGDLLEAYARLSSLHREEPGRFEVQELLLDVLFGLGLDENDFRWVERPQVVRLDAATRDRIHLHLQRCGPKDVYLLRFELFHHEYLCFDEETLAAHLRLDPRFEVEERDASRESGWQGARLLVGAVPQC